MPRCDQSSGEVTAGSAWHSVEVDGLRIAYQRAGEGPPLILLHGFFGDSRVWRRKLENLSDEFEVVAWDTPGCGRSSDPPDTFRMPDYARCLSAFVEALRLERPHVLGLSFGSTLALELYRQQPRRWRRSSPTFIAPG